MKLMFGDSGDGPRDALRDGATPDRALLLVYPSHPPHSPVSQGTGSTSEDRFPTRDRPSLRILSLFGHNGHAGQGHRSKPWLGLTPLGAMWRHAAHAAHIQAGQRGDRQVSTGVQWVGDNRSPLAPGMRKARRRAVLLGRRAFDLVPATGFEPTTFCSGGRRSIH